MAEKEFKPARQIVDETSQPETAVLGASGGVQRQRSTHRDLTDVTPAEARELGITDKIAEGWVIKWTNRSEVGEKAFGYDTVLAAKERGAVVIRKPGADQPFTRHDVALTLQPPEFQAQYEAEEAARTAEYLATEAGDAWPDQFDQEDKPRLRAMARAQSQHNRASGLINPEHGMTLAEGLRRNPDAAQRERDMAQYRRGPRHVGRDEREAELAERAREQARSERTGKKSFSTGAGFDAQGRVVR